MYDSVDGVQNVNATLSYDSNSTLSGVLNVQYYRVCNANSVRALGGGVLKLINITDSRILTFINSCYILFDVQPSHFKEITPTLAIVLLTQLAKCGP